MSTGAVVGTTVGALAGAGVVIGIAFWVKSAVAVAGVATAASAGGVGSAGLAAAETASHLQPMLHSSASPWRIVDSDEEDEEGEVQHEEREESKNDNVS
jgi:hypothetical protein